MRAEDRAVAHLAASVADGAPIDWSAAEAQVPHAERRLIRHLRLVESISTLYRTLPPEPAEDLATTVPEPSGPRWGPLVLLERIGAGTSCEVHKAWDSMARDRRHRGRHPQRGLRLICAARLPSPYTGTPAHHDAPGENATWCVSPGGDRHGFRSRSGRRTLPGPDLRGRREHRVWGMLTLFGMFGGMAAAAALLAAVGLYGAFSCAVGGRMQEFGVRQALGASAGQIRRLVFRAGWWTVVPGMAIGMIGGAALSRYAVGALYAVTADPLDPLTYAACGLFLVVACTLALWVPARRAGRAGASLADLLR